MPKHTLYLTDEALGVLKRVSNASAFTSAAIVRSGRDLTQARTVIAAHLTRDEIIAAIDATNGLFITPDMPIAAQVAADTEDAGHPEIASRIAASADLARAVVYIRDAYFAGVEDLEWVESTSDSNAREEAKETATIREGAHDIQQRVLDNLVREHVSDDIDVARDKLRSLEGMSDNQHVNLSKYLIATVKTYRELLQRFIDRSA